MRITTGLEIVKENYFEKGSGIRYIQDAIDYILYLEKEIETLKELVFEQDDIINSLDKVEL